VLTRKESITKASGVQFVNFGTDEIGLRGRGSINLRKRGGGRRSEGIPGSLTAHREKFSPWRSIIPVGVPGRSESRRGAGRTAPWSDGAANLLGGKQEQPGATLFLVNCVSCHGADRKGRAPYIPPLAGNPVTLDGDPSSLINLVLNGAEPLVVKGTPDAYRMPQYRVQLTDDEIAKVLTFVRSARGNGAAS